MRSDWIGKVPELVSAWPWNGRELFSRVTGGEMFVVEVEAGEDFQTLPEPRRLGRFPALATYAVRTYDVTRAGDFVGVVDRRGAGLAPTEPQPVTSINIVLNWFEELKRLVPVER